MIKSNLLFIWLPLDISFYILYIVWLIDDYTIYCFVDLCDVILYVVVGFWFYAICSYCLVFYFLNWQFSGKLFYYYMMYNVYICNVFLDCFCCVQRNIVTLHFIAVGVRSRQERQQQTIVQTMVYFLLVKSYFQNPKNSVIVLVLHCFSTTFLYFLDLF